MSAPAVSTRRADGAPTLHEPQAPCLLHIDPQSLFLEATAPTPKAAPSATIDIAAIARQVSPEPLPARAPALTPLELQLLDAAEQCARGDAAMPPRRELVGAALREAERERWWRDVAEAESEARRHTILRLERELSDVRAARRDLLNLLFEIVGWAAGVLGCKPAAREVFPRIRARGSFLQQVEMQAAAGLAQRIRAEVAGA